VSENEERVRDFPLPRGCPMLPPPDYARMRAEPPQRLRLPDGTTPWVLTRHADVVEALGDPRLSADELNPGLPHRLLTPRAPGMMSFSRMDPPEHSRLRKMVTKEFTARSVRGMRGWIQELVDELLDELERGPRPADLFADFAVPLACMVIARIFGVPQKDIRMLKGHAVVALSQDATAEQSTAAGIAVTRYLYELAADRAAARDTESLLGRLAVEFVETGQITIDELVGLVRLVLVAGFGASANQLGLGVLVLLQHPQELAEVRRDPTLIGRAVEEILRYWAIPQDNMVRVATDELKIGQTRIAKGEAVFLAIPSANHDETVFPEPERFDIHRDTRRHLSYSSGVHYCLGATLATAELELAIAAVIERLPGLKLAVPEAELSFRDNALVYGLNALPVSW
jgi:cytochrome P450